MKLITTRLQAPVLRQRILAEVHSQGKPTAFEKMTVSLVKTGQSSDELKGQSIPALFELLVGDDSASIFLDATLNRLFSPTSAVLGVAPDVRYSSYRDLPVDEIEVLANGEELLRSGLFPTQSRTIHRSVIFNPLSGAFSEDSNANFDMLPDDEEHVLPESLATSTWPDEAADVFVKKTLLRSGDVLSGVSREGDGTVGWVRFSANLELADGTLKASSSQPGAADYLNGLGPDDFRRLMLHGLEFINAPGPVRSLDGVVASAIFSPFGPEPVSESWVWLHPDSDRYNVSPKGVRLAVVWPTDDQTEREENSFSPGSDGSPDRLVLGAAPYPDMAASGDLREFHHIVKARAFFARTPMEIPIGLRERLSEDAAASTAEGIVSALESSGHPRALAHAAALRRNYMPNNGKPASHHNKER